EQAPGGFRSDEGGELRFRPAGCGQVDRAGAPERQHDRRQPDQPDEAQHTLSPAAPTRLDGGEDPRGTRARRSRWTVLTLERTIQRAVIVVQEEPLSEARG